MIPRRTMKTMADSKVPAEEPDPVERSDEELLALISDLSEDEKIRLMGLIEGGPPPEDFVEEDTTDIDG